MSDFVRLSRAELEAMAACGAAVAQCGRPGVLGEILGSDPVEEWRHYPAGDIFDPATHGQYFYHAHPPGERGSGEHGHFHIFLRARGMPRGVHPLVLPELAIADSPAAPAAPSAPQSQDGGDPWCHLVAIAMDAEGLPLRLFTTNRWVTGETWYRASDVELMLDRFAIATGPKLLGRWITGMVGLFKPEIASLIRARDEAVMGWRRRRRGKVHVFDDRRLEVTAALDIDVDTQLRRIDAALRAVA
jgi:hypothetical protein